MVGKRNQGVFKEDNDWMLGLKEIFGQILLIFQTSAHRYPPIDDPVLINGEVPILFPIGGRDLPQYPIRSLCVRDIEFPI